MRFLIKKFLFFIPLLFFSFLSSCSHDEVEPRRPEDILGVWSPSDTRYFEFGKDYTVHYLDIEYQDGENIGLWTTDAYLYEPGYDMVVYLKGTQAEVYKIIELTSNRLTWCWVEVIEIDDTVSKEQIGHILGDIIKKAQEGFKLNPELYQSFRKVPENDFFSLLESLDILYPW